MKLALKHLGEPYILGAIAPKDNASWKGPWDCAEFASWCVYQVSQQLYGCDRNNGDPAKADAYSGFWVRDAKKIGTPIDVSQAANVAGAFVLRKPQPNLVGHVAISDGLGGTVEAHSSKTGVIQSKLGGRRWDMAVLIPWISYAPASVEKEIIVERPRLVLRLRKPPMTGQLVKDVQRALKALGFHPGPIDGLYGPKTMSAVTGFQLEKGLAPDGEVGMTTAKALKINWP
jgi:N-acetylmuramoyl-L-alanine amidase